MTQALEEGDAAIAQHLRRVAAKSGPLQPPDAEVVEYDWRLPRRFVPAELRKLDDFLAKAAEKVSAGLSAVLGTEMKLAPAPFKQHYLACPRQFDEPGWGHLSKHDSRLGRCGRKNGR